MFVLARTGANCPCRGFPAVVFAGVAFEVPRVRSVARAGGFAETPYYTTARSRSVSKPELRILRGGGYWELLEELIAELVGVQQEAGTQSPAGRHRTEQDGNYRHLVR